MAWKGDIQGKRLERRTEPADGSAGAHWLHRFSCHRERLVLGLQEVREEVAHRVEIAAALGGDAAGQVKVRHAVRSQE